MVAQNSPNPRLKAWISIKSADSQPIGHKCTIGHTVLCQDKAVPTLCCEPPSVLLRSHTGHHDLCRQYILEWSLRPWQPLPLAVKCLPEQTTLALPLTNHLMGHCHHNMSRIHLLHVPSECHNQDCWPRCEPFCSAPHEVPEVVVLVAVYRMNKTSWQVARQGTATCATQSSQMAQNMWAVIMASSCEGGEGREVGRRAPTCVDVGTQKMSQGCRPHNSAPRTKQTFRQSHRRVRHSDV